MSKRFTDSEKWKDPWFRKLSAGVKIAFGYMCDNCDNAGVWAADFELADFQIGMKIPWEKVQRELGDRLTVLSDEKWLLTKFVGFQYGELSPDCKPHLAIIRLMDKHGIDEAQRVSKGYPKGLLTLKDKDKDKDKEGNGQEGMQGEEKKPRVITNPTFINLWHDKYLAFHGEKYFVNGAKDGMAAKKLLAHTPDASTLLGIASEAWGHPDLFNCKQAVTIAGFAGRFQEIKAELKSAKPKFTEDDNQTF